MRSPEAKPLAGCYTCCQTGVILQGKTLIASSIHSGKQPSDFVLAPSPKGTKEAARPVQGGAARPDVLGAITMYLWADLRFHSAHAKGAFLLTLKNASLLTGLGR